MQATRLIVGLLMFSVGFVPTAVGETGQPPAPEEVTVDAETESLLTPPARPGTNVTVRVVDVPSGVTGFDLVGPIGELFLDQTSRHDGSVEFWHVPAVPGDYHVNLSVGGTERTLANFTLVETSSSSDCGSTYGGSTDCGDDGGGMCWYYPSERVDEEVKWTPIVFVNSPSGGWARASQTLTKTQSLYLAPADWESSTEHSQTLEAEDGASKGQFRLAKWGIYREGAWTCSPEDRTETAKVVTWSPNDRAEFRVFDITGRSNHTDGDNPASVGADGYGSVWYDLQYHETDGVQNTDGGAVTHTITDETFLAVGATVAIGSRHVTFEVLEFSVADGEERSYLYHFPEGGEWHWDELARSPGLAFCRPTRTSC